MQWTVLARAAPGRTTGHELILTIFYQVSIYIVHAVRTAAEAARLPHTSVSPAGDPGSSSRGVSAERKMFAMKLVCMESLIVIATLLSTTYTASPLIGRPRPLTTELEYLHRAAEIF